MTEKTLDWLNHNRFRAYPFADDEGLVRNRARVPDCVLLDCLVTDTRHLGYVPELVFTEIDVTQARTKATFTYAGEEHSVEFDGSNPGYGGSSSLVKIEGHLSAAPGEELLYMSFVFSSHAYILENVGEGTWRFSGRVLPSKVVSVAASGVMGVEANGSANVPGHESAGTATGEVQLADGFRTQPVVQNGKVLVKVGNAYGENPCHYEEDSSSSPDGQAQCGDLLLFFCGQNAPSNGNIVLEGGAGVSVKSGGLYTARRSILDTYGEIGIAEGESAPCIEIVADTGLMRLYRPSEESSGSADSPDSSG